MTFMPDVSLNLSHTNSATHMVWYRWGPVLGILIGSEDTGTGTLLSVSSCTYKKKIDETDPSLVHRRVHYLSRLGVGRTSDPSQ